MANNTTQQPTQTKRQTVNDILNLNANSAPVPATVEPVETLPVNPDEFADKDFIDARSNIRKTIQTLENVIRTAAQVAAESGEPRAIEVANQTLKTMIDASDKLVSIHKTRNEIARLKGMLGGDVQGDTFNQQNNIFVGTASELKALLKKEKEKVIDHE